MRIYTYFRQLFPHFLLNIDEVIRLISSMYELEGTVKLIDDTQTFGSGFKKREFVVTSRRSFPRGQV